MGLYDKVFVLNEEVQYPDGCNVVEIEGTGDERAVPRFPNIRLTLSPLSVMADGVQMSLCNVTVADYNSSNPFEGKTNFEENVTTTELYSFSVGSPIRQRPDGTYIIRMWEDPDKQHEIPYSQIQVIEGSQVKLKEPFYSAYYDANVEGLNHPGFIYGNVTVQYDTGPTINMGTGLADRWWETKQVEQSSVSGLFFLDKAGTVPLPDAGILIPPTVGQVATVQCYFKPDADSSGFAYINAEYNGYSAYATLTVVGLGGAYDAQLTAEPGSIEVSQTSQVSLALSSNNEAMNGIDVKFSVLGGSVYGTIDNPLQVTGAINGVTEEATASAADETDVDWKDYGDKFSLGQPPKKITSIVMVPDLGIWTWNGQIGKILGNDVALAASNALPYNGLTLRVVYNSGGVATCTFRAPDTLPQKVDDPTTVDVDETADPSITALVAAEFMGRTEICSIQIGPPGSGGTNLQISAESPVAPGGSSTVTVEHELGEVANGKTVILSDYPKNIGSGPASVVLGTKEIFGESQNASSTTTVSVSHNIKVGTTPVIKLENEGTAVAVASFTGKEITLGETLAWPDLPLVIDYIAVGIAEYEYAINADTDATVVYVGAYMQEESPNQKVSASIEIQEGGGPDLSLIPNPAHLPENNSNVSEITVFCEYYNNEDPQNIKTAKGAFVSLETTPLNLGSFNSNGVLLDTSPEIVETGIKPTTRRTLSVEHTIDPTSHPTVEVEWNGQSMAVESFEGSVITLLNELEETKPKCTVTYHAAAHGTIQFTASGVYRTPVGDGTYLEEPLEMADMTLYVRGTALVDGKMADGDCEITLGDALDGLTIEMKALPLRSSPWTASEVTTIYRVVVPEGFMVANPEWRTDEQNQSQSQPNFTYLHVRIKVYDAMPDQDLTYFLKLGNQPPIPRVAKRNLLEGCCTDVIEVFAGYQDEYDPDSQTFPYKASIYGRSADTTITIQKGTESKYLTYQIPIATLTGWMKPGGRGINDTSSYFLSENTAKLVSDGLRSQADSFGGVDQLPTGVDSEDNSEFIQIEYECPTWLDMNDVTEFSATGAAKVLQTIHRASGSIGQNSFGPNPYVPAESTARFAIQWQYKDNMKEFVISVREFTSSIKADSEGARITNARVVLGTGPFYVADVDGDGNAIFSESNKNLPPAGEYDALITAANHKANRDPQPWNNSAYYENPGVYDTISTNDTVIVPAYSTRKYLLLETKWTIVITATVYQRPKYDALAQSVSTTWDAGTGRNTA